MTEAPRIGMILVLAGLITYAICLPLIWGRVPMNRSYGIRIAAAFESNERWYAINAYGGRVMARFAWVVVALGGAGFLVPANYGPVYVWLSPAVVLFVLGMAILQILVWARKPHRGVQS